MLTTNDPSKHRGCSMLNKLTIPAVGAAILVTVASASMGLLRGCGPMTNQLIGVEPVPSYFNFEDIFH